MHSQRRHTATRAKIVTEGKQKFISAFFSKKSGDSSPAVDTSDILDSDVVGHCNPMDWEDREADIEKSTDHLFPVLTQESLPAVSELWYEQKDCMETHQLIRIQDQNRQLSLTAVLAANLLA